jgi:hypothetical protein
VSPDSSDDHPHGGGQVYCWRHVWEKSNLVPGQDLEKGRGIRRCRTAKHSRSFADNKLAAKGDPWDGVLHHLQLGGPREILPSGGMSTACIRLITLLIAFLGCDMCSRVAITSVLFEQNFAFSWRPSSSFCFQYEEL